MIKRHHCPSIIGAGRLSPQLRRLECGFSDWARNSPVLISRIMMVVKRACGIRPPKISPGLRRSTARAPSCASQYGHVLSLVVTNARQFGHIRRLSTERYCTVSVADCLCMEDMLGLNRVELKLEQHPEAHMNVTRPDSLNEFSEKQATSGQLCQPDAFVAELVRTEAEMFERVSRAEALELVRKRESS